MAKKEEKGAEGKTEEVKKTPSRKDSVGIMVVRGSADRADAAIKDGWMDTTFFIESHGNDQEAVAQALKNTLMVDLKNEKGVVLREMKFHPVVEQQKLYAGFVECAMAIRDPQTLMFLSLRYGPSAVEVHSPDRITLTRAEMQGMAADTSAAVQVLIGKIMDLMPQDERVKKLQRQATQQGQG
jgi:hypothetical protein